MKPAHLLHSYDTFRRQVDVQGATREEIAGEGVTIVRHVDPDGTGTVVYARLEPAYAAAAVGAQVAAFRRRSAPLEWLVYTHDRPADLGERLLPFGFVPGEPETVMLLPVDAVVLPRATKSATIRPVSTPAGFLAVATIRQLTWGGDVTAIARRLEERVEREPGRVSVYLALVGEVPAATAQITYYPSHAFASLGSAATLPRYRRRGLYSTLLRVRLLDAQRRRVDYVDTEASPLSRPLLERAGFCAISSVTVYAWEPETAG